MKWFIHKNGFGEEIAICVQEDRVVSGLASAMLDFQEWLAEGNTPEEWNTDGTV